MTNIIDEFDFLNNDLLKPYLEAKEPNLLDIAKVSTKELPISNLYAYFLDPNENHGLGSIFLEILIEFLPKGCFVIGEDKIRIEREVHTYETGKYIDLVITDGNQVIVIENKIFADLYNKLELYKEHFQKQNVHGVILSIKRLYNDNNFTSITHNELINSVIAKLKSSNNDALSQRQLYNFNTFVEILKNMEDTTMHLDDSIAFFRENSKKIVALQSMKKTFISTILQQVDELVVSSIEGINSNTRELSVEYTFKDTPSLVMYTTLEDSNLAELRVELWIRNSTTAVQEWRNTDNFIDEKKEIKALGLLITTDKNPQGGDKWAPTVIKSYSLNSFNNKFNGEKIKKDLNDAWKNAITIMKHISNR
jgi:hypothetical protein